jgi:Zn-dependent protease
MRPRLQFRPSPFGRALFVARFRGIDVLAHWSVLFILALLVTMLGASVFPSTAPGQSPLVYAVGATLTAVLFMLSLLAHELAHSVVAMHFGHRVRGITVWMLGGLSEMTSDAGNAREDALIAGAGPFTSIVLGSGFGAATWLADSWTSWPMVTTALAWLAGTNLMLGAFNLIPAFPLDGGRLFHALLWWRWKDRARSTAAAARAGAVFGSLLIGLGIVEMTRYPANGLWLAFIGWFIVSAAKSERYAAALESLGGHRVGEVMSPLGAPAASERTVSDFVDTLSAADGAHDAFVVVNQTGHAVGLLTWADLEAVPRTERPVRLVRDAMHPLTSVAVVSPDEPLSQVLPRLLRHDRAVVVWDGQAVGTVSEADVVRFEHDRAAGSEVHDAPRA